MTELLAEENAGDVVNPASASRLTVLFRSGLEIALPGEEADPVRSEPEQIAYRPEFQSQRLEKNLH